jgi:tetratricopeptide (TPR) repeat protein
MMGEGDMYSIGLSGAASAVSAAPGIFRRMASALGLRWRTAAGLFMSAALAVMLSGCIEGTQDLVKVRRQVFPFEPKEFTGYVHDEEILTYARTDDGYWFLEWARPDKIPAADQKVNVFEIPPYDGWLIQLREGDGGKAFAYFYARRARNELQFYAPSKGGIYRMNSIPALQGRLPEGEGTMGSADPALGVKMTPQNSAAETFDVMQQIIRLRIDLVKFDAYTAADQAIAAYTADLQREPGNGQTYDRRGVAYMAKGDPDRAIADFTAAMAGDRDLAQSYYRRARAHQLKGDLDRAVDDFTAAIQKQESSGVAYSDALYGRGMVYHDQREFDRAIADFSAVIEDGRAHNHAANDAYYRRGLAYEGKGNVDRAIVDYSEAIELAKKTAYAFAVLKDFYAGVYDRRGNLYALRGERDNAARDLEEALRLAPDRPGVREDLRRVQAAPALREQSPGAAAPERRVALVIGNSAYRSVAFLPNPRRDARAVADALRLTGFQTVELALDLDRDAMVKALRSFRVQADAADWALIYYAGHGIEIDRVNYLIPVDANLVDDRDVKSETVSYEELLGAISNAKALRMLVLDACRVNPFKERMRRSFASRDVTARGLAPPPEASPGTLVVYSAKEGEIAADDVDGVNSPFALAFIAQIKVPGREVRRVFDLVRDDVMDATSQRQQPYTYGSVSGRRDFFFVTGR